MILHASMPVCQDLGGGGELNGYPCPGTINKGAQAHH